MSPSSNSVYSSVFTYNPYVLTRPYRHLTFVASIEPHCITCISHDISVLIDRARACRMDTPCRQKRSRRSSTKVSWLLTNFITHRGCSDSSTYTFFSSFLRYCGSISSSLSTSHRSATSYAIPLWSSVLLNKRLKRTVRQLQNYNYS